MKYNGQQLKEMTLSEQITIFNFIKRNWEVYHKIWTNEDLKGLDALIRLNITHLTKV